MAIITSHHENLLFLGDKLSVEKINDIVQTITFDILEESPELVAEVESGKLDRGLLERAIIKNIDKHKFYYDVKREKIIKEVFNYMFGYGILQPYIEDEDISDIDGTRYDQFTYKKNGKKMKLPISFYNEENFENFCKIIAIRNGGLLNENDSHCRVSDEKYRLRINVSIRPRNISGPAINIRKHRKNSYSFNDLINIGMMNDEIAEFLYKIGRTRASVLFCGKGASGKTTLLRAFLNSFSTLERVLVCESDSELYPENPSCIVQKIKKANEGGLPVTLQDLIRDGLTMSLDTYCVGEIVGNESWEFIKAGFTGHRILGTIHSIGAEDAFDRMLTLIKSAKVDHTDKTIRRILSKSIDIIVHLKNFTVAEVLEVVKYDEVKDKIHCNTLYKFDIKTEYENERLTGNFRKVNDMSDKLKDELIRRDLL